MIKFSEHFGASESPVLSDAALKEITPQKSSAVDGVLDYWEDLFEDDISDSFADIAVRDIYGYSDEDFSFDFFPSSELKELTSRFYDERWAELSDCEKQYVIDAFADRLASELNIAYPPQIEYFSADKSKCGAFISGENKLELNRALLDDPSELVDTVAHEMRHAYQNQCAENPQSIVDLKYKYNFYNYILPITSPIGKCLLFTEYQDQFVEAEARAFAKLFAHQEVSQ